MSDGHDEDEDEDDDNNNKDDDKDNHNKDFLPSCAKTWLNSFVFCSTSNTML